MLLTVAECSVDVPTTTSAETTTASICPSDDLAPIEYDVSADVGGFNSPEPSFYPGSEGYRLTSDLGSVIEVNITVTVGTDMGCSNDSITVRFWNVF